MSMDLWTKINERREGQGQRIKGGGANRKGAKVKGMAWKAQATGGQPETLYGVFVRGVMFGVSRETICNWVALIDECATELH